jgi:tetratricopeptide (TPR) repeat protein
LGGGVAEETEGPESGPQALGAGLDPAAIALALNGGNCDPGIADDVRAYLRKQGRLADLQHEMLAKSEAFEVSHLRWRRFDDQMKGAIRIMLVAVGALAVAALATAMWNAAHADGLVVEAFAVPPSLAATGLSADAISEDITERINGIRREADSHSLGNSHSVQEDSRDEVRVEIPETGVSLTQAWRYLKSWLGNERHLRGTLRADGDGRIALAVSFDGEAPVSFAGPVADLEKLEQQAAEHVYAGIEPINYVVYLEAKSRFDEALTALGRMTDAAQTPENLAEAYGLSADFIGRLTGDFAQASARSRIAMAEAPRSFVGYLTALRSDVLLSHQEDQFRQASAILTLKERDQQAAVQGRGWVSILLEARRARDHVLGDYPAYALNACNPDYCSYGTSLLAKAHVAALAHDPAASRALIAQALVVKGTTAQNLASARYGTDMAAQDWQAALRDAGAYISAVDTEATTFPGYRGVLKMNSGQPWLAEATARAGNIAGGEALIAPTPLDCDACVLARGRIAALKQDWTGAARWFQLVSARSTHIPFADADWGAMLLAHGQHDSAIEKFALANQKGPHFADALEGWGEALMAKNQSHLALAKFAEADKYAPNWGRLHLKWGEALTFAGKADEAKAQFARAATLDLTPSEKAELAGMVRG